MAITHYEWTRSAPGPFTSTGFPDSVYVNVATVNRPFDDPGPWTLIRTEAEIVMSAFLPSGSGPEAAFLAGSNVRTCVKWYPGDPLPPPPRNDSSSGVLGHRLLVAEISGDPAGVAGSCVTWRLNTPFENKTMRNAGESSFPTVGMFLYMQTAPIDADMVISTQLSALWGR